MDLVIQENKRSYVRLQLFDVWQQLPGCNASDKSKLLQEKILASLNVTLLKKWREDVIRNICRFTSEVEKRWKASSRTKERFLKKNVGWLNGDVHLWVEEGYNVEELPSTSQAGRPTLSFAESSERSKRRKTEKLRTSSSPSLLSYAMKMKLRSEGKHDAVKILSEALDTTPTRATKIRKTWVEGKTKPIRFSPEEALSLMVEANLSKTQYLRIRLQAKDKNVNIYPSYSNVIVAKNKCYPSFDAIIISDVLAEVKLQALLDHTLERILLAQEEVIQSIPSEDIGDELTLISKWGCDGSTGHSEYKQKLGEYYTDSNMFITSFVPLQLYSKKSDGAKIMIWQNPRTSSVRFCRPIRIQYLKETTELAQDEIKYIEEQINKLNPFNVKLRSKDVVINHQMVLTMVDGKICNAATSTTSAQLCYVCKASPKEMNQLDRVLEKNVDTSTFRFGLSTLHAWIRFFECFLHIAYRLPFQKWQARGRNNDILKERKQQLQKEFREQLGLLVDHVRPGGSGTTNDGNTARKFFKHPETVAQITGLNVDLIKRCGTILQAMASGFRIDTEKFKNYAKDTAKLYVELYPWYYMPSSVHKILIHGAIIIESAILPIGQLSEEAQECRNKDLKMYRRSHTRKLSREATNEDLLHCLLVSSDPYISGMTRVSHKRRRPFAAEVLELLLPPEVTLETSETSESSETSEDENISEDSD